MFACPLITLLLVFCKDVASVCMYLIAFQNIAELTAHAIKFALLAKIITATRMSPLIAVSLTAQLITMALIAECICTDYLIHSIRGITCICIASSTPYGCLDSIPDCIGIDHTADCIRIHCLTLILL